MESSLKELHNAWSFICCKFRGNHGLFCLNSVFGTIFFLHLNRKNKKNMRAVWSSNFRCGLLFFLKLTNTVLLLQCKCVARILDIKMCCFLSDLASKNSTVHILLSYTLQLHVIYLAFSSLFPTDVQACIVLPKKRHCNKKRLY